MEIASLELRGFRNISSALVHPGSDVNLFLGRNGQGKTNLVEAVAFLSWLKSFRTSRSADVVQTGQEGAFIGADIVSGGAAHRLEVMISAGSRRVGLDGLFVRSVRDVMKTLAVAFLSPDDPAILEGGPEGRRSLIDRFATMLDSEVPAVINRYTRQIRERNSMLKADPAMFDETALDAVEEAIGESAQRLIVSRRRALNTIIATLPATLASMSGDDLDVDVRYVSRWLTDGVADQDVAQVLVGYLRRHRHADRIVGYTTGGPHTDDIDVRLKGLLARGHASRGQKKVLMLAWKASEAIEYTRLRNEAPILVLDDALSDLDAGRQARVVAFLDGYPGQSFVTSAVANADVLKTAKVFLTEAGGFNSGATGV